MRYTLQARLCLGLGLVAAGLSSVPTFSTQQLPEPSQAAELARTVQALNEQLITRSKKDLKTYTPDKVNTVTAKIHNLLTGYILSELNQASGVSANVLAEQLRMIQGKYVLPEEETNTPYVSQDRLESTPVYLTAYLLYRGGAGAPDSKAVIEAFARRGAKYFLAGEAGGEFDSHGLFVRQVTARREGELWYLVHGVRFGASHRNLRVVLYSFGGENLRPIWLAPDLPRGEVIVTAEGIELKYLDMDRYRRGQPPYFRTERYRFTNKGLKLEKGGAGLTNRTAYRSELVPEN